MDPWGGGGGSSEVMGALMEDRSVASFVKNGCLFKLKGELVC